VPTPGHRVSRCHRRSSAAVVRRPCDADVIRAWATRQGRAGGGRGFTETSFDGVARDPIRARPPCHAGRPPFQLRHPGCPTSLVLGRVYRAKHDPLLIPTSAGAPRTWRWDGCIVRSTILCQLRHPGCPTSLVLGQVYRANTILCQLRHPGCPTSLVLGRVYRAKHDPLPTRRSASAPRPWCWDGCIVRSTILFQLHGWQGVATSRPLSMWELERVLLVDPGLRAPGSICAGPPGPSDSPRTRHQVPANRPPRRAAAPGNWRPFLASEEKPRHEWEPAAPSKQCFGGMACKPIRSRPQLSANSRCLSGFSK
jgi:hypothetical protein